MFCNQVAGWYEEGAPRHVLPRTVPPVPVPAGTPFGLRVSAYQIVGRLSVQGQYFGMPLLSIRS
jgi:hypothetical protein